MGTMLSPHLKIIQPPVRRLWRILYLNIVMHCDLDLWLLGLKITRRVIHLPRKTCLPTWNFLQLFVIALGRVGTRPTGGRTDWEQTMLLTSTWVPSPTLSPSPSTSITGNKRLLPLRYGMRHKNSQAMN